MAECKHVFFADDFDDIKCGNCGESIRGYFADLQQQLAETQGERTYWMDRAQEAEGQLGEQQAKLKKDIGSLYSDYREQFKRAEAAETKCVQLNIQLQKTDGIAFERKRALCLLNSMVLNGEKHTEESLKVVNSALEGNDASWILEQDAKLAVMRGALKKVQEKFVYTLSVDGQFYDLFEQGTCGAIIDEALADDAGRKYQEQYDRMRDALEKLACLGNGDKWGNSIGNRIAQDALPDRGEKNDLSKTIL
jgi:hypothetical protein